MMVIIMVVMKMIRRRRRRRGIIDDNGRITLQLRSSISGNLGSLLFLWRAICFDYRISFFAINSAFKISLSSTMRCPFFSLWISRCDTRANISKSSPILRLFRRFFTLSNRHSRSILERGFVPLPFSMRTSAAWTRRGSRGRVFRVLFLLLPLVLTTGAMGSGSAIDDEAATT